MMTCDDMFELSDYPSAAQYATLLWSLQDVASFFVLVLRDELGRSNELVRVLDNLFPFKAEEIRASGWPGTVLLGGQLATVLKYRSAPEAIDLLCDAASGPFAWVQPDLPEDLSFLRADGSVLMNTIAHERELVFMLRPEEIKQLSPRIKPHYFVPCVFDD